MASFLPEVPPAGAMPSLPPPRPGWSARLLSVKDVVFVAQHITDAVKVSAALHSDRSYSHNIGGPPRELLAWDGFVIQSRPGQMLVSMASSDGM